MSSFDLHLMRHGMPETPGLMLGHKDMPSSAEGISLCCERARSLYFDAISSSDLCRSSAPAQAIAQERSMTSSTDRRWREINFGQWDGLLPEAIDAQAIQAFWNDPETCPPPEGERWSELVARVSSAINELPERDSLIITHGGAMRAALSAFFGWDHHQAWAFDLPYSSVLTFRIWSGSPRSAQITGLRT